MGEVRKMNDFREQVIREGRKVRAENVSSPPEKPRTTSTHATVNSRRKAKFETP